MRPLPFAAVLAFAASVCASVFATTPAASSPVIEIDLRVVNCMESSPVEAKAETRTQPLEDGSAVFTQATQLPGSELYVGYWISVSRPGTQDPFASYSVRIYYNEVRGFLELEPGKYSPLTALVEINTTQPLTKDWNELQLRDPKNGATVAIVYLRARTTEGSGNKSTGPALLPALPAQPSQP